MLEQADLKERPLNDKLKNIISRKGKAVSGNNNIPIGIINVESLLLTKEQLVSNQESKKTIKRQIQKIMRQLNSLLRDYCNRRFSRKYQF